MKFQLTAKDIQTLDEFYEYAEKNLHNAFVREHAEAVEKVLNIEAIEDLYLVELNDEEHRLVIELVEEVKKKRTLNIEEGMRFNNLLSSLKRQVTYSR